jgi:hypothetical protein
MNRRDLLRSASFLLGTVLVLRPQSAPRALTMEAIEPSSPAGMAFANHCGGSAEHAGLLAQLQNQLAARVGEPGTTLSATATCPICGCPVTATRTVR